MSGASTAVAMGTFLARCTCFVWFGFWRDASAVRRPPTFDGFVARRGCGRKNSGRSGGVAALAAVHAVRGRRGAVTRCQRSEDGIGLDPGASFCAAFPLQLARIVAWFAMRTRRTGLTRWPDLAWSAGLTRRARFARRLIFVTARINAAALRGARRRDLNIVFQRLLCCDGEGVCGVADDLKPGFVLEDADRPDLGLGDMAQPADQWHQPFRVGVAAPADIEAEPGAIALGFHEAAFGADARRALAISHRHGRRIAHAGVVRNIFRIGQVGA